MGVPMDHKVGRELLLDVSKALDDVGLPFFLMCGTALGAYRDKGFTPQEDDIDLGFLVEDFVPVSLELFTVFMRSHYECYTLILPFNRCWGMKVKKHGIGVDLVGYIKYQDQIYGDSVRFSPNMMYDFCALYPDTMLERPEKLRLFDREFWVPSPVEDYLSYEYGFHWNIHTLEHAYHVAEGKSRCNGFFSSRAIPPNLLDRIQ